MHFPGIIPALITPFDADDRVDVAALGANVAHLLAAGVDGFVATGTMGEAGQLSQDERDLVVGTVVAAVDGAVPVVAGVSSGATAQSCTYALRAVAAGVSGVMCTPPVNYEGTERELAAFFGAVAEAAGVPVMAYNNPIAAGVDLSPALIGRLAEAVPEIVSVKECSGDARRIAELLFTTDLEVLVGGDDWAMEGAAVGAAGWVSGVANVAPAECLALWRHTQAGELAEARELYRRLLPLARLDMTPKLVQHFKGAMDAVGLAGGAVRGPRLALDAAEQAVLEAALAQLREPARA